MRMDIIQPERDVPPLHSPFIYKHPDISGCFFVTVFLHYNLLIASVNFGTISKISPTTP